MVFAGSLSIGGAAGDLTAVVGALCSAATLTIIRHRPAVLPFAALAVAGFVTAGLALVVGAEFPQGPDVGLVLFQGLVLLPCSIALTTTALTRLPAPEVSLITRLELVLGSVWVWAVLGETPSLNVIVAGAGIIAIFIAHSWMSLKSDRRWGE
jgi:drug/metabolite transporter (DMT)-like permease